MIQGEIILYKSDATTFEIEVRMEDDTVWLTQTQMVELFDSTKQNINLHISNIFKEGELTPESTVKENLTVQIEGKRSVTRKIIDNETIYHIGASLKDLGKKLVVSEVEPWFAFSKLDVEITNILDKIND
jgi:hypothetical protein